MDDELNINGTIYVKKVYRDVKQLVIDYVQNYKFRNTCINRKIENDEIKISLPNCNNEWTFEVFEFARRFTERFKGSYIDHANDGDHFLHINIGGIQNGNY